MSILSAENCLILIGSSLSKHPLIHKNQSRVHRERRLVCTQFGLGGWRQFCENANPIHTPQLTETITKSMRSNEKHIAHRSFDIIGIYRMALFDWQQNHLFCCFTVYVIFTRCSYFSRRCRHTTTHATQRKFNSKNRLQHMQRVHSLFIITIFFPNRAHSLLQTTLNRLAYTLSGRQSIDTQCNKHIRSPLESEKKKNRRTNNKNKPKHL